MSNLDNTQLNPNNKTINYKGENYNYTTNYNCGENNTCSIDSEDNFITTKVSTSTKDCNYSKGRNTCTLFTLSKVIIIDLDEE